MMRNSAPCSIEAQVIVRLGSGESPGLPDAHASSPPYQRWSPRLRHPGRNANRVDQSRRPAGTDDGSRGTGDAPAGFSRERGRDSNPSHGRGGAKASHAASAASGDCATARADFKQLASDWSALSNDISSNNTASEEADSLPVQADTQEVESALTLLTSDANSQRDRDTLSQLKTGLQAVGATASAVSSGDQQTAGQQFPSAEGAISSTSAILSSNRLGVCGG
jgi:hypothetical protein